MGQGGKIFGRAAGLTAALPASRKHWSPAAAAPRRAAARRPRGGAALCPAAGAQAYPARPVRLIVATTAGATSDIVARLTAQWLTEHAGQQFIVENRPGGGNNIGTRGGGPRHARRLHAAVRQRRQRHQRDAVRKAQLQFHLGYRTRSRHHPGANGDADQPGGAGQDGAGIHRAGAAPIRARSTWPRQASARRRMWPANCSR